MCVKTWRLDDNLQESSLFLHHVGLQIELLGSQKLGKLLYLLSHLITLQGSIAIQSIEWLQLDSVQIFLSL